MPDVALRAGGVRPVYGQCETLMMHVFEVLCEVSQFASF